MEIETGDLGLRDEDPTEDAAFRVLAIGDSYTFGWGVDESERFTEQLEALLADSLNGRTIRVLNAGHWSYTFDQQLLTLKELLPRFRPHLVIQGVYAGHVVRIGEHRWDLDDQGAITSIAFEGFENEIQVREDGALKRTNRLIESPPLRSRFLAKLAQKYFRWKQIGTAQIMITEPYFPDSRVLDEAWVKTGRALRQTANLLEAARIKYLMFDIPADLTVHEAEWSEAVRDHLQGRKVDLDLAHDRFRSIAVEVGATWVSTLDSFRSGYDTTLYFPRDPHWTASGHRLAAEVLFPAVLMELKDTR